jgi:hypothetical protein
LVTEFVNLKIKSAQSFKDAYRGRIYVRVFIGECLYIYIYIYKYYTIFKKTRGNTEYLEKKIRRRWISFPSSGGHTTRQPPIWYPLARASANQIAAHRLRLIRTGLNTLPSPPLPSPPGTHGQTPLPTINYLLLLQCRRSARSLPAPPVSSAFAAVPRPPPLPRCRSSRRSSCPMPASSFGAASSVRRSSSPLPRSISRHQPGNRRSARRPPLPPSEFPTSNLPFPLFQGLTHSFLSLLVTITTGRPSLPASLTSTLRSSPASSSSCGTFQDLLRCIFFILHSPKDCSLAK